MDVVLLLARLALAGTFAAAGGAKLNDRDGTRRSLAAFGVGPWLAMPGSLLLPLSELVVAVALLPVATARLGAAAGLALLAVFSTAITVNLIRGRRPDCRCFGQLHSAPVGRATLIRDAVLMGIAGLVVLGWRDGGIDPTAWFRAQSVAQSVPLAAGLVLAFAFGFAAWTRRRSRVDEVQERASEPTTLDTIALLPDSPPPPDVASVILDPPVPSFHLPGLDGHTQTLEDLLEAGRPVFLIFADPDCGTCNALMPEISQWQRRYAAVLTTAIISTGSLDANRAKSVAFGLDRVLIQDDWEVGDAYGAENTPSAILVRADGTRGSEIAAGRARIRALFEETVRPLEPDQFAYASMGSLAHGDAATGG